MHVGTETMGTLLLPLKVSNPSILFKTVKSLMTTSVSTIPDEMGRTSPSLLPHLDTFNRSSTLANSTFILLFVNSAKPCLIHQLETKIMKLETPLLFPLKQFYKSAKIIPTQLFSIPTNILNNNET